MRIIDSNFNDVQKVSIKRISSYIDKVLEFIEYSITDEESLDNIVNVSQNLLLQYTDSKKYGMTLPSGKIAECFFAPGTDVIKTNMKVAVDDKEITVTPGIALKKNYNSHEFIHEFFHAISTKQHNYFDDNGVAYTKTGFKILFYDKELDDYEDYPKVSCDALDEGLTELLTSIVDKKFNGTYAPFVVLAQLFGHTNGKLIEAYFSNYLDPLLDFYDDLDKRKVGITHEDLIDLDPKETDIEVLRKIINGATRYCLETSSNREEAIEFIKDKMDYLDEHCKYNYGSWHDFINMIISMSNY